MDILKDVLESLAVGDAMGMPTEFMTQRDIDRIYPDIHTLLDPQLSYTHHELPFASVTDDTEQNLYLIQAYLNAGEITVENSAQALSRWVVECDAVAKRYIGPSSLRALNAIRDGVSPLEAGRGGTTCGGLMRTPALVLCSGRRDADSLLKNIRMGCIPTHHTSQAIEAAASYGFALQAALEGKAQKEILSAAAQGAQMALQSMDYIAAAPSCIRRLKQLEQDVSDTTSDDALRSDLYNLYGTGLESIDVFTAVFGIFLHKKKDVFGAICLAASLGGDTDTIAALVGTLCTAYAGRHNIPGEIVDRVVRQNGLCLEELSGKIRQAFWN